MVWWLLDVERGGHLGQQQLPGGGGQPVRGVEGGERDALVARVEEGLQLQGDDHPLAVHGDGLEVVAAAVQRQHQWHAGRTHRAHLFRLDRDAQDRRGNDAAPDVVDPLAAEASRMGKEGEPLLGEPSRHLAEHPAAPVREGHLGREDEQDHVAAAADQGASGSRRAVAQPLRGLEHPALGGIRDLLVRGLVEDVAHRGPRHAGRSRDVCGGGSLHGTPSTCWMTRSRGHIIHHRPRRIEPPGPALDTPGPAQAHATQ